MSRQRTSLRTGSRFEIMEPRCLMAGDVIVDSSISANRNIGPVYLKVSDETRASDVNLDGFINHRDAHAVISFLNARTQNPTAEGESESPKLDINGDGEVSPRDVLWIVNQIKQYDPLTPCDCGACTQPTTEARCVNASLAQTQSANLLSNSMAPAGEFAGTALDNLITAAPSAVPLIEDVLSKRK